ncbi:NAD-dependent epimerase/dehydratase family protein [Allostreptomyces psammosilenae]|uniref:Nucleoside-diphosphate-sugar epimerase n=1 Tax=Allostreptomyces psammosilenae TaxID=1892865 RepID=A0A853A4B1_9ACTN|nr:NAD-dependent epimerase/dehydratase family protein [Allostreptomyces psammosilenae]NYI05541.1 nucleoside-diphosphate-sugar epimerase [Allostreptomyces psammosilenae]
MTDPGTSTVTTHPARRVLITGAAGFIGSHLAQALVATGAIVIGVDRRDPRTDPIAARNLAELRPHPTFIPITADLRTCAVEPLLLDAEVVYHLAGIPGVRPSWGHEFVDYVSDNLLATQRLMDAAARLGVPRLVVASSSSVYGATDGRPSRESDHPRPMSPYAVTKLAQEQLCLAHASRPDCPTSVVALRYFTVYGPHQRADMFIHRVLTAALAGTPVRLYGDGHQRRDFTYVDDVVAATIAAGHAPAETGVVNVGAGTGHTLHDVITTAEHLTGHRVRTEQVASSDGDVPTTLADTTKAAEILNWQPRTDLTIGMTKQFRRITTKAAQLGPS